MRATGGRRKGETLRPETQVARAFARLRSDPVTARHLDEYLTAFGVTAMAAEVIGRQLQEGDIRTAPAVLSSASGTAITDEARAATGALILEEAFAGGIPLRHAAEAIATLQPRSGERINARVERLRVRIEALVSPAPPA